MNKITTIGITSPCGGNGCTTLAVHLAWQASQIRGIRTLAVSMDRTGALVRQFFPDGGLRVDSVAHILGGQQAAANTGSEGRRISLSDRGGLGIWHVV